MNTPTHHCCTQALAACGAVRGMAWSICPRPLGRAGNPRRASGGALAANV